MSDPFHAGLISHLSREDLLPGGAFFGELPDIGRGGANRDLAGAFDEGSVGGVEGVGANEGWWSDDEKRRVRELIPIIDEFLLKE